MNDDQRKQQIEERVAKRSDPRYVDVKAQGVEQRRYILADDAPHLVGSYQTARIPDHIAITQINAEGFTATPEAAAELFAFLDKWEQERQQSTVKATEAAIATPNEVLQRERHQKELGNVPQGSTDSPVPVAIPQPSSPSEATGTTAATPEYLSAEVRPMNDVKTKQT
jgi:hypothetical protein